MRSHRPVEAWAEAENDGGRDQFTPSEKSQAAGREYLKRIRQRTDGRDPEVNEKVAPAQLEALGKWRPTRKLLWKTLMIV